MSQLAFGPDGIEDHVGGGGTKGVSYETIENGKGIDQLDRLDEQHALVVHSPDPLDHALARRMIAVVGAAGVRVEGESSLADDERAWLFTPRLSWAQGAYALVVQTTIEDLAGNNIGKPFEVDLCSGISRRITNDCVRVEFKAQ